MKVERDDVLFLGKASFNQLPNNPSDILTSSTTPNVSNKTLVKGSGVVITITNLIGGSDSQQLRIIGDGTTTIPNNTFIKTNTGANKLLAVNKVYTFSYFISTSLWYENA